MIGDKLVVTQYHREGALQIMKKIEEKDLTDAGIVAVSVAGESGSGKSEIAYCLCELLDAQGKKSVILAQDDYFKLPPKSNHQKRLQDIGCVGPSEVKLDLLDQHVQALKERPADGLEKPLVYFEEDRIDTEVLQPGQLDVVVTEGTYTTLLQNMDLRAFIDRTYHQTKKARLKRARDPDLDFIEKVLEIEHREISKHKSRADVIIVAPPEKR